MKKRYLLVDDEEISLSMLEFGFSEFGECATAGNGQEALSLYLKAREEGKPYDLVCTDITMPVMDGLELIRGIREYEHALASTEEASRTVIFVISVNDSAQDMEHALLDCDSDDYIVKPIRRDMLENLLEKYRLIDAGNPD